MKELDKVLHQPVRTRIMAHLVSVEECDYTSLRNTLSLSDGHMSTHMKELIANDYVRLEKLFIKNKPKTIYRITPHGRQSFADYVKVLQELLSGG